VGPVVAAAGVLALALAGCSVEVVDADPTPASPRATSETPSDRDAGPAPDAGTSPSGGTKTRVPASDDGADGPALPGRATLLPVTTAQIACAGGDAAVSRAGAAVEVTDDCDTLTVDGAAAVVVAGDVGHLVVAGAGAQVAVRSVTTVTIESSAVTVTWEEGTPTVSGDTPGSAYGAVAPG
jgi:hypothetical protein